jgi:hypothetical protein
MAAGMVLAFYSAFLSARAKYSSDDLKPVSDLAEAFSKIAEKAGK